MEKKVKEELGPRCLEVEALGRRNCQIFYNRARTIYDFKLYFLRILYSWNQVLIHGTTAFKMCDETALLEMFLSWSNRILTAI